MKHHVMVLWKGALVNTYQYPQNRESHFLIMRDERGSFSPLGILCEIYRLAEQSGVWDHHKFNGSTIVPDIVRGWASMSLEEYGQVCLLNHDECIAWINQKLRGHQSELRLDQIKGTVSSLYH